LVAVNISRYALDKYVYALLGRTHLDLDDEEEEELLGTPDERRNFSDKCNLRFLTPQELFGLKAIIMYIHALPVSKKNVPALITEPINLVRDIRIVVGEHKNDDLNNAVTGSPLLYWPGTIFKIFKCRLLTKTLCNMYKLK
jgi:F-box/leucine-rich repeat protein 10/11